MIESRPRLLPIEVKLGKRTGLNDMRGLRIFLEGYSDMAPFGFMLYGSAEVFLVTDNVLALPSACLF